MFRSGRPLAPILPKQDRAKGRPLPYRSQAQAEGPGAVSARLFIIKFPFRSCRILPFLLGEGQSEKGLELVRHFQVQISLEP